MNRFRFIDVNVTEKNSPPIFGYRDVKLVSLEEAIEPIASQVLGLREQVKWAKKHCHFPSKHGLTKDESAALYLYTMEGGVQNFYEILNNALRSENRPALKLWFPYLKLFVTATDKLPVMKCNIWRGIRADVRKKFTAGEELVWWSISSCTSHVDVVQGFLSTNSTLFMIEALNGRNISEYSYIPKENEVILGPGTTLHVVGNSLQHLGGLHIVHLREVNEDIEEKEPISTYSATEVKKRVRLDDGNGQLYEGEVDDNNIYHGHGILVNRDGTRNKGEFRNGRLNGQGITEWKNGKYYEGQYKDNQFHGWGKMTFSNGRIVEGRWENGEFIDATSYFD